MRTLEQDESETSRLSCFDNVPNLSSPETMGDTDHNHPATREDVKKITERVDEIKEELGSIKEALLGDVHGSPGMIHRHNDLLFDMYDKEDGIVARVKKLEDQRMWAKGWLAGVIAVSSLLGGLIAWILNLLFSGHQK